MEALNRPAEEFGNDSTLEMAWAAKAFEYAEVYFNLITSVNPKELEITPCDEKIYKTFREDFPTLEIGVIDENAMKSVEGKNQWREFIEKFNKVTDFNVGTLLRIDASQKFSEENSMFVIRIQFLAIEIARNREGYNNCIRS